MRTSLRAVSLSLVIVFSLAAVDTFATCYRCRNYTCYMAEGTKAWCEPITGGCFSGGLCSGGGGCELGCVENPEARVKPTPLSEEWRLASVTIRSERKPVTQLADVRAQN
jgi:hypothetical protein